MTTPSWPSSLPTCPIYGSYGETAVTPKVEFESDSGPPIARPASSLRMATIEVALKMTTDQLRTFEDFVFSDLKQASLSFYILHPRKREQVKVRFTGNTPYSLGRMMRSYWQVSFSLMVIG